MRANSGNVHPICHDDKNLEQSAGMVVKNIVVACLNVVVADSETLVDGLDLRLLVSAQDGFVKVLQQDVVDFAQGQNGSLVMVHESFDTEACTGVDKPQTLREVALKFELQPVVFAFREQV